MSDAYRPERQGPQFDNQPTPAEGLPLGVDDAREQELLEKFDRWNRDMLSKWSNWREEAKQAFDFAAGHQWDPKHRAEMEDNQKIPVVFNITGPTLDAVGGAEIQNRQECQYYPRTVDKTGVADVLTQAVQYLEDDCNGDQEDSEAFYDTLICGVGWTVSQPEIDGDDIDIPKQRVDPLEMMVDPSARKPNFEDARYLKREQPMSRDEFEDFLDQYNRHDVSPDDMTGLDAGKRMTIVNPLLRYTHGMLGQGGGDDEVVLCEWQWWEKQPVFVAPLPHPTEPGVVKLAKLKPEALREALKVRPDLPHQPSTQKLYYRALVADQTIIFHEEMPEKDFRYKAITGKRDRNQGTWFGLVRPMADPQRFLNKLYSEILHIVRTNANGGLLLEEDAVADIRSFEATWAAADKITWIKPGGLSNANGPKVQPKTPVTVNPALFSLMQFAQEMVQACTGVNEEILGMVGREQPGVLEAQRKQAAYGILSAFFDAKRRYQRDQGKLRLAQIRAFLPNDKLVRIVDQGTAVYVPIANTLNAEEYDVIVDEAPAGPNAKARVMAALGPMLPELFQAGIIGPEQIADLLQYLDIPASVANALGNSIRQRAQAQAGPQQMEMQAQQTAFQKNMANKDADTAQKQAKAARDMAVAQSEAPRTKIQGVQAIASMTTAQAENKGKGADQALGLAAAAAKHTQQMQQSAQKHQQQMAQSAQQAAQDRQIAQEQAVDAAAAAQAKNWRPPVRLDKPIATEQQPDTTPSPDDSGGP